jgi:hypothetical protein
MNMARVGAGGEGPLEGGLEVEGTGGISGQENNAVMNREHIFAVSSWP